MRTIDTAMGTSDTVTTLAFCCKITRRNGFALGFTSFDTPLLIDTVTFEPSNGFQHTALEQRVDLEPDTLDIQAIIDDDRITEADLLNGLYDAAVVENFLVNYQDLAADRIALNSGLIRGVSIQNDLFVAEIDGLNSQLKQAHLDLYAPSCRVKRLGDVQCRVSLAPYTFEYTINNIMSEYSFQSAAPQDDQYFRYGILEWLTGDNTGLEATVKNFRNGLFELMEPPVYPFVVGDTFKVIRGCNRQFETCKNIFDNVENFRGEPAHLLPGLDKIRSPLGN